MLSVFKSFLQKQDSLERKLFWSILVVVTAAAAFSAIFTVFEGLSLAASLCSVGCIVLCLVVAVVAVKTSLYNQCYLVMCCVLSCFLLPLLFLFCGGITSGMPLYCITSTTLLAFSTGRGSKVVAFVISLCIQVGVVALSWIKPELLIVVLDRDDSYLDFIVTHVLTAVTLFVVGSLSILAYAQERNKNGRLSSKLDFLTLHDALTGIYNRKYMMMHLSNTVWQNRGMFYVMLLAVDGLKGLNDRYGYPFGDTAICTVANILKKSENESVGECVARYGGETFVYVINAVTEVEAYAKAELVRKNVFQSCFNDHPEVRLTISAGVVSCKDRKFKDFRQMLSKADSLLEEAKKNGRNQICTMAEN